MKNNIAVNAFDISVLDSLTAHIAVLNAQGIIVVVNKAWRQFGAENGLPEPSHNLLGANYLNACKNTINQPDGNEANAAQAGIAAVLAGEQEDFYLEYPCHSSNQQRWFSMKVSPLQGSVDGVVVSHENITERKQTEIALRNSESRFSAVIDASPVPMALNDTQGSITYLNPAFMQTLGYTLNDIPTLTDWWSCAYPDPHYQQWVIENWQNHLAEATRSNQPFVPVEINITCKDGTVRIFIAAASLLKNFAGVHLVTLYDITERKWAEETIQASKAKLEAALASMSDAVFISDTEGRFIEFNDAFATFHKFKNKEDCPQILAEYPNFIDVYLTSGEFVPLEQRTVPRALRGETGTGLEFTLRRKDSGETWIGSYNYAPIRNNDGVIVGSVVTARDITEYKKAEVLLRESEEKLRLFIHYSPSAIAMFDCEMRYLAYSHRWLVDYGLAEQNLVGRSHYEVFPDLPERWKELHRRSLAGAIEKCDRDPFPRADGSVEWIHWEMHPWRTNTGNIGGIILFSEVITERVKMEEALIAGEKEFRLLADAMPQIIWVTNTEGENTYLNQQWVDYTGLSLEESYGDNWSKPLHPDDLQRTWNAWQDAVNNYVIYSVESRLRRADGVYRWWLIRGVPAFDEHGNLYKWFGTCTDIHDIKEAEKVLRDSESQLQFILQTNHIGVWDLNVVNYSGSRSLEHARIFGYESLLPNWSYQRFIEHILPEDREQINNLIKNAIAAQTNWDFECRIRRVDGEVRWIWVSGKYLSDDGIEPHIAGIVQDITKRKKAEETIFDLAYYDPLTRLPNRHLMLDRLKQALISRKLKSRYGAVLFMDLNDFKTLNDTKGHAIGDLLLIEVSLHLKAVVHEDDTVARTGGNEFVVLLETLDKTTDLAATQAKTIAKRLLAAIGQLFDLQGYAYRCSASIGIALFHSHEINVDELVKQATMAMHQAKQGGKNTIRFFDPAIQEALEFRVQLESWMRTALNEQYELYYQIQIDDKGKATGAESLIRWHHPEQGTISPANFIPLAEETGLILPIGQWVLETACAQLKAWEHNAKTQHLVLAVNVSAKQFAQKYFVKQVLSILEQTGANPDRLKLELTESMLVDNVENIITKMNALKVIGVKFSLDDFGTGFSSLSYLSRLPLNQLKIDQSFVRDALIDSKDAAIIRTIIALGQSLSMEVIAEGVETEAQRHFLAALGCNHYQGYLFSKPLPLEEFEQLLHNKSS